MPELIDLEKKYFPTIPSVIPYSGNTDIKVHVDGENYFAAIYSALNATEGPDDRIYIASWLFVNLTHLIIAPKTLLQLLVEKAQLGVDVRVIVWTGRLALGTEGVDPDVGLLEYWLNRNAEVMELFTDVVGANIQNVRSLRAETRPPGIKPLEGRVLMDWSGDFGSRHQKYTVVYRKSTRDLRAFVGGIDFSESNRNGYHHPGNASPHDVGVECTGEAARSVWSDFKTRWAEVKSLPSKRYRINTIVDEFNPPTDANIPPVPSPDIADVAPVTSTSGLRIVRSYDRIKDSMLWGDDLPWATLPPEGLREVWTVFQKALLAATRYVYIEDQATNQSDFLTSHIMLWRPLSLLITKGVKVICVTSGEGTENQALTSTVWSSFLDHVAPVVRTNFAMFRVNGLEIHSKVVLIDDEFLSVGSANFWDRSMLGLDTELNTMGVDTGTLVKDLRVRLWADHLRVDPFDADVRPDLSNLDKSLSIFRRSWGTGVSFCAKESKLKLIGPFGSEDDNPQKTCE